MCRADSKCDLGSFYRPLIDNPFLYIQYLLRFSVRIYGLVQYG